MKDGCSSAEEESCVGRDLSILFSAYILVFSLSRFPIRFSRRAAEDGLHSIPSRASKRFTSAFSERSIMLYSLLPICSARVVGLN